MVKYLYRALTRRTGYEAPGYPAPPLTGGGLHDINAPARNSVERGPDWIPEPPLPSLVVKEEVSFHPDIIVDSPAVKRSPELFYALSGERMTKDRVLALEQIRVLRSRIMELMHMRDLRTLLVTSAVAEEGKTITSLNLALALSHVQGMRILLVDADLRKPSIAKVLGLGCDTGLLSYLQMEATLDEAIVRLNSRLSFMPAKKAINSVELLHSPRMKEFLATVRSNYSLVIFDAPPLYCIADSQILANYVDSIMLCIRAGRTSVNLVAECAAMVSPKLIGTVLVGGDRQQHGYAYSYSHYARADAR